MADSPIQIERMRRSLYRFAERAWPIVDPSAFVGNWHLEMLSKRLEEISSGEIDRGVINVPPGTGKSLFCSVFWPAWVWIDHPEIMWQCISYTPKLSVRDAGKLIRLVTSDWYVGNWGPRIDKPSTVKASEFGTIQGGGRFSTSIHGPGTGWHCDIQVFDDPIKPDDASSISGIELQNTWEIMGDTFGSRHRDETTFRRAIVMQRIQEGDPAEKALDLGWTGLRFPMLYEAGPDADPYDLRTHEGQLLFPQRHSAESIAKKRLDMTENTWETQYQQRPSTPGGLIIEEAWIDAAAVTLAEALAKQGQDYQSWDFTFKGDESSDFVSGQHWRIVTGGDRTDLYLLACDNERMTFEQSLDRLRVRYGTWPAVRALFENKANGPGLESMLKREFPGWIKLVEPRGSKVARAHRTAPAWKAGKVHLCHDAPYFARLKRTIMRFPHVVNDDEVDTMTQMVNFAIESNRAAEKMKRIRDGMR